MSDIRCKKLPDGRVLIEIEDLWTKCPVTSKEDISNIVVTCKKSALDCNKFEERLGYYIKEKIEDKKNRNGGHPN